MSNETHEPELVITAPTAWKVLEVAQNEPTLVSYGSFIWRHGKILQSVCNRPEVPCEPGKPKEDCTCGIYCCDTDVHREIVSRIQGYLTPSLPRTCFLVKLQLYGRIIVCQTGFRAGAAKLMSIRTIFFNEPPIDLAADLEANYGVPVSLERYQDTGYYDPQLAKQWERQRNPKTYRQPAPPMYLSDYVKLFYTLDSGRKVPEDLQVTFVREYMKKLTKETKKTNSQLTALTQHSEELNRWMTDLKGFIASIRKKP